MAPGTHVITALQCTMKLSSLNVTLSESGVFTFSPTAPVTLISGMRLLDSNGRYFRSSCNKKLCVQVSYLSVSAFNLIALRTAKTLWSFGHSECNRAE